MERDDVPATALSRRQLLAGAGTGAALLAAAACSGGSSDPSAPGGGTPGSGSAGGGGSLAAVADVPVGGAVSAQDAGGKPVIVAQPSKGQVVAFSAICTHMGCTVAPAGNELVCPCHGSTYDLATGDNTSGPAPSPLPKIPVKVKGGKVVEG
jgi:cytochrome b6-f complex iron-sulfur subunit